MKPEEQPILGLKYFIGLLIFASVALLSCITNNHEEELSPTKKREQLINKLSRFSALPEEVKFPDDNPYSEAKAELGRLLFFDPILSGDKDVACATCHHPSNGYAEFLDISIGVNGHGFGSKRAFKEPNSIPFTKRNSQTVLNTAFNGINDLGQYDPATAPMFWDLRAESLENQALEPIKSLEEMRGEHFAEEAILEEVVQRLKEIPEYQTLFSAVFGTENPITAENMAKAIATFERTLVTNNSRFDRYMRGDKSAMSISEREGFAQFKRSGCGNCHNGPMFSDYKKHILGVNNNKKLGFEDKGIDSTYAFRTPSLRNLRFTAPYMHNGTMPYLLRVLEFYEDISGGKNINPHLQKEQLDPLVKEINLRVGQMRPIMSFLNTLNDEDFDKSEPESVPSGLPVGGNIQ
jgi:cytochrome c peroxidase